MNRKSLYMVIILRYTVVYTALFFPFKDRHLLIRAEMINTKLISAPRTTPITRPVITLLASSLVIDSRPDIYFPVGWKNSDDNILANIIITESRPAV